MTTVEGRRTVSYIVTCALAAGDSLVKQDQNGLNYTFPGSIGLCPEWKPATSKQRALHDRRVGLPDGPHQHGGHPRPAVDGQRLRLSSGQKPIGWGVDRTNFPMQEGTFFGDIISTGQPAYTRQRASPRRPATSATAPVSRRASNGVVAGRLGANQAGAPYKNPFGNGVLCQNASGNSPQYSNGVGGSCPLGLRGQPRRRLPGRI